MNESIVFFGTGPVAAKSLELLSNDFKIEAVITKPRPLHHHGSVPVLELAEKLDLPVFTADNRGSLNTLFAQSTFTSRVGVLIDFGIIIDQAVIDYFPLGIINSHFSLLPEWRGADPITFSILSGQKQTGVSLMQLVQAMDEGPLIAFGSYDLPADITTPQLTEHLINFSYQMLKQRLPEYLKDGKPGEPQSVTGREVSYSRKLSKDDSVLDFTKPAVELERQVRAFIDWPQSRMKIGDTDVIITKATPVVSDLKPGKIKAEDKRLFIGTSDQALEILELKPAGKSEMTAAAFLNGYTI